MKTTFRPIVVAAALLAAVLTPAVAQQAPANPPTIVSSAPSGDCIINEPCRIVDRGPAVGRIFCCPQGLWTESTDIESGFAQFLGDPALPYGPAYMKAIYGSYAIGAFQPFAYHLELGSRPDDGNNRTILDLYSSGNLGGPYTDHAVVAGAMSVSDEVSYEADGTDALAVEGYISAVRGYKLVHADADASASIAFDGVAGVYGEASFDPDGSGDITCPVSGGVIGKVTPGCTVNAGVLSVGPLGLDTEGDGTVACISEAAGVAYPDADCDGTQDGGESFGGAASVDVVDANADATSTTSDSSLVTMKSYVIPAGTLAQSGDTLHVIAWGEQTIVGEGTTYIYTALEMRNLAHNGTADLVIIPHDTIDSGLARWMLDARLSYATDASVATTSTFHFGYSTNNYTAMTAAVIPLNDGDTVDGAWSLENTLKLQVRVATGDTLSVEGWQVIIERAP